jgi:hypothetical protein
VQQVAEGRRGSRRGSKSSPKKSLNKSRSRQLLLLQREKPIWPPAGYSPLMQLSKTEMTAILGDGALEYVGSAKEFPFSEQTEEAHRFYSTTFIGTGKRGRCYTTETDLASRQDEALREISLCFMGREENMEPKGSLEYPNMLYAFGRSPGTTSLTWYIGMRGQLRTPVDFNRGSEAKKRRMKLITILERLNQLTQQGLREVCSH